MNAIISFCKENFQLNCLLVGLLGVIIGIISVIHELKKRQKTKKK